MSSVAAILSGLWPKSSMTVTPFASPTFSNRRFSPVKRSTERIASIRERPPPRSRRSRPARWRHCDGPAPTTGHDSQHPGDQVEADGKGFGLQRLGDQIGRTLDRKGGEVGQVGQQRRRLRIARIGDDMASPACEPAEQVAQFLQRLVVQADIVQHRNGGVVERDRAVAFVHLADERVATADQRAGKGTVGRDEVLHHRAVHRGRIAARFVQDEGDHAGDGRLAAGPRHADRQGAVVEQAGEHLRTGGARAASRFAATMSGTVSSTAAEAMTS